MKPRYPASGGTSTERHRDFPQGWGTKRLKYIATINDDKLADDEDPLRPMAYVDIGTVDLRSGIDAPKDMVFEDSPSRARRLVRDGDTIVSTVRTYLRAIARIQKPTSEMVVSTGFAVVRPTESDPDFTYWTLCEHGFVEEIVARSVGVSYPAINSSEIGVLPVPQPPPDEQPAIAAHLDRETARIDELIMRQELLIERLDEYRTALITRTVTKGLPPEIAEAAGLDPALAFKDSGVEWLGEVPEHWDVVMLKRITSINDEALSDDEDPTRPVDYVDIGSVRYGDGIVEQTHMVFEDAPSRARRLVQDGDTIISTVRTYLRAIAQVVNPPRSMVVSTGFAVVRPLSIEPRFAYWAMSETGFVGEIVARSVGVSYPAINATQIGLLAITVPPRREQRVIADYLDAQSNRIDALLAKARVSIERLSEYRSALISAAVTGKIDVRDTAPAGSRGRA